MSSVPFPSDLIMPETKLSLHSMLSLQSATLEGALSFVPPITYGKVVKVYDGDTITIVNHLQFGMFETSEIYKFQVRLSGIDCPEIRGKSEAEKTRAKQARDVLSALVLNKIVELRNVKTEKYGRLLADIYLNGVCLNDYMISEGYAVSYDGGSKIRPEDWDIQL